MFLRMIFTSLPNLNYWGFLHKFSETWHCANEFIFACRFDVFVITAQMLVNAMVKGDLRIESFSLIIFDECHHCHGGHAFYKTMIPYHDKKLEDPEERILLPQVSINIHLTLKKSCKEQLCLL